MMTFTSKVLVGDAAIVSDRNSDFTGGFVLGVTLGSAIGAILGATLVPKLLERSQKRDRLRDRSRDSLAAAKDTPEAIAATLDSEADIARAQQSLADKIAQLHTAIEDARASLPETDLTPTSSTNGSNPRSS